MSAGILARCCAASLQPCDVPVGSTSSSSFGAHPLAAHLKMGHLREPSPVAADPTANSSMLPSNLRSLAPVCASKTLICSAAFSSGLAGSRLLYDSMYRSSGLNSMYETCARAPAASVKANAAGPGNARMPQKTGYALPQSPGSLAYVQRCKAALHAGGLLADSARGIRGVRAHVGVGEADKAGEGGSPPQRDALPVHGGEVGAVGGPAHKGLRPEGALVDLLRLRPLRVVPADLRRILIPDHKLVAAARVHHPVP